MTRTVATGGTPALADVHVAESAGWRRATLTTYRITAWGALVLATGSFVASSVARAAGMTPSALTRPNVGLCVVMLAIALLTMRTQPRIALGFEAIAFVVLALTGTEHLAPGVLPLPDWILGRVADANAPGRFSAVIWLLAMTSVTLLVSGWLNSARSAVAMAYVISSSIALTIWCTIAWTGQYAINTIAVVTGRDTPLSRFQITQGFGLLLICIVTVWVLDGQWRSVLRKGIAGTALRLLMLASVLIPIIPTTLFSILVSLNLLTSVAAAALLATFVAAGMMLMSIWVYRKIRALETALLREAKTDAMTGLLNNAAFTDIFTRRLAEARRRSDDVSVVAMDLDGLKAVNDTFGHDAGSELIRLFAHALVLAAREEDLVARLGGDEFAWVLRGDSRSAIAALERLNHIVRDLNASHTHAWTISFSAGVTTAIDGLGDVGELLGRADREMYRDKLGKSQLGSEFSRDTYSI